MLLKILLGAMEWHFVNGDSHCVHLRQLIQSKCPTWPEGGLMDLCDLESGTLVGTHILEAWDMAGPCFLGMDTQKKYFIPVALTVGDKGLIQAIEPMLDDFAKKFPDAKATLDSMLHTKIKEETPRLKRKITATKTTAPAQHSTQVKGYKSRATKKIRDKKSPKQR